MDALPLLAAELPDKALWAKCATCGHCWAVAYYPMEARKFAKLALKHSDCPKCGGRGMLAKQAGGVLHEPAPEAAA